MFEELSEKEKKELITGFNTSLAERDISTYKQRYDQQDMAWEMHRQHEIQNRDREHKQAHEKPISTRSKNADAIEKALGRFDMYKEDSPLWLFMNETMDEFLMSRANRKPDENGEIELENSDELIRTFRLLVSMGPAAVTEENSKVLTAKCFDDNMKYAKNMVGMYDIKMEMMRSQLRSGVDTSIFLKSNVEKMPDYAARELNRIKVLSQLFAPGTPTYMALSDTEKKDADYLKAKYEFCKKAFEAAMLEDPKVNDGLYESTNLEVVYPGSLKADMDAFFEELEKKGRTLPGMDERVRENRKKSGVNADFFGDTLYGFVDEIKNAVAKNPGSYKEHKEGIDKMMQEFMTALEGFNMKMHVVQCLTMDNNDEYYFESFPEMKAAYAAICRKYPEGQDLCDKYIQNYITDEKENIGARSYMNALYDTIFYYLTGEKEPTVDEAYMTQGFEGMQSVYETIDENRVLKQTLNTIQNNPDITYIKLKPIEQMLINKRINSFTKRISEFDTFFIYQKQLKDRKGDLTKLYREYQFLKPFMDIKFMDGSDDTLIKGYFIKDTAREMRYSYGKKEKAGFDIKLRLIDALFQFYKDEEALDQNNYTKLNASLAKIEDDTYKWLETANVRAQSIPNATHPLSQGIDSVDADLERFKKEHPEIKAPKGKSYIYAYGAYYEKEIEKLSKAKPKNDMEKAKNEAKITEYKNKVKWARIHLGINSQAFSYVGAPDVKALNGCSLARSVDTLLDIPVIKNMDPYEYIDNLEDFSAHIFFHDPTQEELLDAKERQTKAIRREMMLYEKHLLTLERNLGYEMPTMSMVVANFDKIARETNFSQDCLNLIILDTRVLDDKDPADIRLRHLARYMAALSTFMMDLRQLPMGGYDTKGIQDYYEGRVLKQCPDSIAYLKTHDPIIRENVTA